MTYARISGKRLAAALLVLVLGVASYFAVGALVRERPEVRPATVHTTLSRESCIDCHAPIAVEWRQSFHFRSLSGPFWQRIRARGADQVFQALRVPCVNCHAPANVLDLDENSHPDQRPDALGLGVDCVSCHVSEQGIRGAGHGAQAPHEVIEDERFRKPALTSTTLCARCHDEGSLANVVADWRQSSYGRAGVTCLDCHMPDVEAPSVLGGPIRVRRSHRFIADKDPAMLRRAVTASIRVTDERTAIVSIVNDGAGHSFPAAGTNWFFVNVKVTDTSDKIVEEVDRGFGTSEWLPGYLDFWPFLAVTRIPPGESREIAVDLGADHGRIDVELRYRDWFAVTDQDMVFATLTKTY